ncbi:MAG: uncharacterized protein QOF55_1059, partial [Thermoleophilaceae bacterium]|nr:uncharacterized protein [Thermoleophilaceae bacterium]
TDREHELLGAIPYQPNEAVLHTDQKLLPRRRRAWASWNYHLLTDPPGKTVVTYHMNRLQALRTDTQFCVTLNRTDATLLPRRRRAWASWNYHLLADPPGKTTVTYHMNRLQSLRTEQQFCVTLNRTEAIDPAAIIRKVDYAHPVFTAAGEAAQGRHEEISGRHTRTHYCGAYWGWGFHEDGVKSGIRVAERFAK